MIVLLEDTRQQSGKHNKKHEYFVKHGIVVNREVLRCGDYQLAGKGNIAVDTKKDLQELIGDIQVKQMPKKDIKAVLDATVPDECVDELMHIICDDDSDRLVEAEITSYCYSHGISDADIGVLQSLYVKRFGFFHRGLVRSKMFGVQLHVLVENKDGVTDINSLFKWVNPRRKIMVSTGRYAGYYQNGRPKMERVQRYPNCMMGDTLAKACLTMEKKYGVKFHFCTPEESPKRILEILGAENE